MEPYIEYTIPFLCVEEKKQFSNIKQYIEHRIFVLFYIVIPTQ